MTYNTAKFLTGPLAGTERAIQDPKQKIVVWEEDYVHRHRPREVGTTQCTSITYVPLPHIFPDQTYTYYTIERSHSEPDIADIIRNVQTH